MEKSELWNNIFPKSIVITNLITNTCEIVMTWQKIHTENTFNLKSIRIFIQTNIVIQFCLQTKPALSSAEVFTQYLYVISLDILYIFGCFIKSCVTSFKVMAVVWRFGYLYPFYIQCFHWQKFPPNCFCLWFVKISINYPENW